MSKNKLLILISLATAASLILAACGPAATPAPTEAMTEAPTEAPSAFVGDVLDSGGCDYGGEINKIEAVDELTVVFTLCRPDPAFPVKIAFTPFGIEPKMYIEQTGGTGDLLDHPIGTGPYMVTEWDRGNQLVYTRFDDYWGEKAPAQTAVLRWLTEPAARLQELQAGTADYVTSVSPADMPTVEADANLQLVKQDNPNVLYIGFTNTYAPFDDVRVRQAIAMGIDRQRIVDNFYPAGSEVADYFTPCTIPNGCEGDPWYTFDPAAAKALLAEAGFPDGFSTTLSYRPASRPYILEPARVAQEVQTQLQENLGITAQLNEMESGEFIDQSTSGLLQGMFLLGWGADYPHVTNFLDYHFNKENPEF